MSEEPQQQPPENKKKPPSIPQVPDIFSSMAPRAARKKRPFNPPMESISELAGLGVEILGSIIGLGGIGWLLDYWLGSFPWLMAVGLILGIIGGLYNAVKKAMRFTNSNGYEYHYKRKDKSTKEDRIDG